MLGLTLDDFDVFRKKTVGPDGQHCSHCRDAWDGLLTLGVPGAPVPAEATRELHDWHEEKVPMFHEEQRATLSIASLLNWGNRLRIPGWTYIWIRLAFLIIRRPAGQIELLHSVMFLRESSRLSKELLQIVESIEAPSERGSQLGNALLLLERADAVKALETIASLRSEFAQCRAIQAGHFGLGQAHPELSPRLVDIARHIESPAQRAKALIACVPWELSSPEEHSLAAEVLAAADSSGDLDLKVFCHIRLRGVSEEVLRPLRQSTDSTFQLEAWKYLIASERNGLSPRALEYAREYLLVGTHLPDKEAVVSGLSLLFHLASFDAPAVVRSEVFKGMAVRVHAIQNCSERRRLIMLVIGAINE